MLPDCGVLVPWDFHLVILHITSRDKKGIHIYFFKVLILIYLFLSVSEAFSFKIKGTVCELFYIRKMEDQPRNVSEAKAGLSVVKEAT